MHPATQKRLSHVEAAEAAFASLESGFDPVGLNALRTAVSRLNLEDLCSIGTSELPIEQTGQTEQMA